MRFFAGRDATRAWALVLEGRRKPVTGLRRHPLIVPIFETPCCSLPAGQVWAWGELLTSACAEEPPPRTPGFPGASRLFSGIQLLVPQISMAHCTYNWDSRQGDRGKKIPRMCRVLQSSEPAFAGRVPTRQINLGRSLSHHCREIGSLFVGVGSERRCSIACTAGHMFYTIKSRARVG